MAQPVILPKMGNSVESCIIQGWLKKVGDTVKAGEGLCEVETDKAVVEVEAPADGTLLAIFFDAEADVPVMTTIAAIGEAGEDASALAPDGAAAPTAAAESAAPAAPAAESAPLAAAPAPAAAPVTASGSGSSPRARALAASEALPLDGLGGSGPNGLVIERDVQAALANRPRLSPAAKAALEANPALVLPARGSGPDGLVRAEDLQAASAAAPAAAPAATPAAPAAPGAVTDIPVKGIRKVIASRMRASLAEAAQLTMTSSFDASALQSWRERAKAAQEALGLPKLTINDLIIFAVSRVLPRHPSLNAHFLGDKIRQFSDVNLGIAVDTPRGLMVPVLPKAHALSLSQIASTFKPLAHAAIGGTIAPEHLSGGTFTITNLGAMGIEHFTPVLNVPEVAILGVGAPVLSPTRMSDGSVTFVDRVGLSLTIDHQAVDGAPAAKFLQDLVKALEHIDVLLAQ